MVFRTGGIFYKISKNFTRNEYFLLPKTWKFSYSHYIWQWKKKKKSAQAEKTLNKLRKAQRLAGEGPQRPEEELFSFSAFSSPLSFRPPPDFNNLFQSFILSVCTCCLLTFDHCSLILSWVLFFSLWGYHWNKTVQLSSEI